MRTLYVVTHPESEHHLTGAVGGWFDSELTAHGRADAAAIARRLRELIGADEQVEVFSSDLKRTAQTAEVIGHEFSVGPVLLHGLREKSYGDAEGRPQAWLQERFVPPPPVGNRMDHDEGLAGAETRRDLATRVYAAVDQILERDCRHQVIVTHGFAITMVLAAWIRMPIEAADYVAVLATSGGISVFVEDDFFHNRAIARLDDTGHLTAR